jgi:hypothetical protein
MASRRRDHRCCGHDPAALPDRLPRPSGEHGYDLARRWGFDEPQSTRTLRTAKVLRQETLATGYTAGRDAAGLDAGFKRAIDEGLIAGPRLVLSLVIISPIGGMGDRASPSGFACCVPNDPLLPDGVVTSPADIRPVVRRIVRAGADVIKCATTGGASSREGHGPFDGAFALDEMQALVEEAQHDPEFCQRVDNGIDDDAEGGRRRAGRTGGRPPKLTDDDIEADKAMLVNPDIGVTQIAHRLGVSPATLYRYLPAARTANSPGV